jgi:hypothetical protein
MDNVFLKDLGNFVNFLNLPPSVFSEKTDSFAKKPRNINHTQLYTKQIVIATQEAICPILAVFLP